MYERQKNLEKINTVKLTEKNKFSQKLTQRSTSSKLNSVQTMNMNEQLPWDYFSRFACLNPEDRKTSIHFKRTKSKSKSKEKEQERNNSQEQGFKIQVVENL